MTSDTQGTTTSDAQAGLAADLRSAALQAQELVAVAQAIEARVSALTLGTPATVIGETTVLIRATALQIAALVHALVAQGERLAVRVSSSLPQ
ncbi:MAG TPA: hypothetical protein VNG33_21550 [Polyangiaceae bacterium]|nr:hypothetical protein [Polyangiaceae bacterium]